jgi:hypothetical protein
VQTADGIEQFQEAIGAAVPPAAYCADLWAQHHTKCKSINKPIGGKLSCHALKTGLAHMEVDKDWLHRLAISCIYVHP